MLWKRISTYCGCKILYAKISVCLAIVYTVQIMRLKKRSGRMLLISLSYPSSNVGWRVVAWPAGVSPQLAGGVLREIFSLHTHVWSFAGSLIRRAQSREDTGNAQKRPLVSRNRDSLGLKLLPRMFCGERNHSKHETVTPMENFMLI